MHGRHGSLLLAACALGIAACSDHGADVALEPPVQIIPVSYAADVQPIWDDRCLTCHGFGGSGRLDLRASVSRASLVDAASWGYAGVRVVPGDPHSSILYLKLEGDASTGSSMPQGEPLLSAAERALVHDWIEAGAADN